MNIRTVLICRINGCKMTRTETGTGLALTDMLLSAGHRLTESGITLMKMR